MRRIEYLHNALKGVDSYIFLYKDYFRTLYSDTGIFTEQMILDRYEQEATDRYNEIFSLIEGKLTSEIVLGRNLDNTYLLEWRSKIISFSWRDEWDIRVVENIAIR